jgi:Tetratricopeptide repeat
MVRLRMAVWVAFALAVSAAAADKKAEEPFYRRFLVPGNPLDEKILEQEKRVAENPNSAALHNDFGNLLAQRRFHKEAREQYEIAMKLDKKNFLAPYNLGIEYETEGEISHAVTAYEKSANINRGFPPSLFRLGRLLERQGKESQAIEAYSKALRIDFSMRDPKRNPLVVDTELLDRVSLTNYEQDMATASLAWDTRFEEEARFRKVPVDRTIWSDEVTEGEKPSVVNPTVTPPLPTATPRAPAPAAAPQPIPPGPGQTRPQALPPPPAGAPPVGAPPLPTPRPAINPVPLPTSPPQ